MPKPSVAIRLDELVDAGITVFTEKGYKHARLQDVAAALSISAPALYNYVEGKEALFDLVVRKATFPNVEHAVTEFPIPSPKPGSTLEFIESFAQQKAVLPSLEAALVTSKKRSSTADELRQILGELFDTLAYFRRGLRLVERCAEEWPELKKAWFEGGRQQFHIALRRYCAAKQRKGLMWDAVAPEHAAKMMIESCAMFAIHRHYDPQPTPISDGQARTLAVDSMVRAFAVSR